MKVIERIKTLLFIGLFISSVTMAGIYIVGLPRNATGAGSALPADVLTALQGGAGADSVQLASDQLTPAFLGIKRSGEDAVGLWTGSAMLRDLSEQLSPWIAFVLGDGAFCEAATDGDTLWAACLAADTYFYLRWDFAVPAAVLRAHCLPTDADAMLDTADGTLPRVNEIFFFPELLEGNICAISRDGAGQVTRWYRTPGAADTLPGVDAFEIYLNRGVLQAYRFAGSFFAECPSRLLTLPVFDTPLSLPDLTLLRPFSLSNDIDRVPENLLTLFDYNLNKVSGYYEADTDTVVFVETHGTLLATVDQVVYEAAPQGGLAVSNYVRKSSSTLNLRDDIIACETLIEQIRQADSGLIGGAASPKLTAVRADGSTLILEYAYYYENVRIGTENAVQMMVEDHRIVSVSIAVHQYRAEETLSRAGGQQWMLNLVEYLRDRPETQVQDCILDLRYLEAEPAVEIAAAFTNAAVGEADTVRLRADWNLYVLQ